MTKQTSPKDEVGSKIARIEGLIHAFEKAGDPALRAAAKDLVQSLMDLHGACLERMLGIIRQSGDPGERIVTNLAQDELASSLLLLYGLHPVPFEDRVRQALEKSRPYLRSHGGNVELIGIDDAGVVTLRLVGSCHSCASSADTLKLTVEDAIYNVAPEVTAIVVEGAQEKSPAIAFVPVGELGTALKSEPMTNGDPAPPRRDQVDWEDVFGLDAIPSGSLRSEDIGGRNILFCRPDDMVYAYGNSCPGCGQPLKGGRLEGTVLACPVCGQRYDIVRAGRGLDLATLHLEPVPLLMENGRAKIAVLTVPLNGNSR